jgi:uncharacterized membrane protein YeaQ/YmgE (transglycosylase-associated protein family)
MTFLDVFVLLLLLLLVAGVIGAINEALWHRRRGSYGLAIVVGVVGGLLGAALATPLGLPRIVTLPVGQVHVPLGWALFGAIVSVVLVRMETRRRA